MGVRQTADDTLVAALTPCAFDLATRMRDYFNLHEPLAPLYQHWASGHPRMQV